MKLVYGHGINDMPGFRAENRKLYGCWHDMLGRCFDPKWHARFPTYRDCTVCDEWLILSNFVAWAKDWKPGLELDKDILCPGNRVYCPERCVFVTRALNQLLADSAASRGKYPIGVYNKDRAFRATIKINGKSKHLGYFDTVQKASNAYLDAKAQHLVTIANQQTDARLRDGFLLHADVYRSQIDTAR